MILINASSSWQSHCLLQEISLGWSHDPILVLKLKDKVKQKFWRVILLMEQRWEQGKARTPLFFQFTLCLPCEPHVRTCLWSYNCSTTMRETSVPQQVWYKGNTGKPGTCSTCVSYTLSIRVAWLWVFVNKQ